MKKKIIEPIIVIFVLFVGCHHKTGGSCVYEKQLGTVLVQHSTEDNKGGVFFPATEWIDFSLNWEGRTLNIPKYYSVHEKVRYPAILRLIKKGSCVPVGMEILSDEKSDNAVFLALANDGTVSEKTVKQIKQAAAVMSSLIPDWPECSLLITGYSSHEYSEEYRLNLAWKYEEDFKRRFAEAGVDIERIKTDSWSTGKNPFFSSQTSNGVQIFFKLK